MGLVLYSDEGLGCVDGAAPGRHGRLLRAAADLAEPERAERVALLLVGAVRRLELRDAECVGHQAGVSAGASVSAAAGGSPSAGSGLRAPPFPSPSPSTSATVRPR